MSKEQTRSDDLFQPGSDCEEIAELLDAYSTNELADDESNRVQAHLASCQRCQVQLAELQYFRNLLASTPLMVNNQYTRASGILIPVSSTSPSLQIVDAVMNEIVNNKGANMKQKPFSPPIQEHPSTSLPPTSLPSRSKWSRSLGLLVAVLCLAILSSTLLVTSHFARQMPSSGPTGVPPSRIWEIQPGQQSVRNSRGTFELKYMDFTQKGFRFFYTFHTSNQEGIPRVQVFSYLSSNPGARTSLPATVQSLGQLGSFNIGVIHVQGLSRAQQIIALDVLSLESTASPWQLTPLKQLRDDPHPYTSTASFSLGQRGHAEIVWYGPVKLEQVAFFKQTASNHSTSQPAYIFVQLDDPRVVTIITKTQYLAIAGKQNFF